MKKSETKGNMTWNNVSTCKVHINVLLTVHLSDQSTLQTPAYKLAKFLVPVLEILTTNKYADMIQFLLTSLEETTEICTNKLFKNKNEVQGLKKLNLRIFYL